MRTGIPIAPLSLGVEGRETATVLARANPNGAFEWSSQLPPVEVLRRPFEFTQSVHFDHRRPTLPRSRRTTLDEFGRRILR